MSAWVLLKSTQNNWDKATRAFLNSLQGLHLQLRLWTPSKRQCSIDPSWHLLKETVVCATEDAVGPLWEGLVVLEHLLSPCLWLLPMKTGFFLLFLMEMWKFKYLENYECESGHTMFFKVSTTKVLLSGFSLIEMSLPFHWVSSFCVLCYCVL